MILNINSNESNKKLPIDEVYIGKTPELIAIEKQLDIFRNKYMKDSSIKGNILKGNASSDPDLLKVNRMFEDYFGFGCLSITVWSSPAPNAFTLSLSHRADIIGTVDEMLSTKNGYKFDKRADYAAIIVVYDSIMFNPSFTTAEVMAVILHEIGHNFNLVMQGVQGSFNKIYTLMQFLIKCMISPVNALLSLNSIVSAANKLEQEMQANNKLLASFANYTIFIYQSYKNLMRLPLYLAKIITLGLSQLAITVLGLGARLLSNPVGTISNLALQPLGYSNELEADNFATIYGYGPETVTVESKIYDDPVDKTMKQIPLIGHIYATNLFFAELLINPIDVHPQSGNRMQDQLDLLKHEIKKEDLDPKMKKVILEDIKVCEKELDKLRDISAGIKDPEFVKHLYWRVAHKVFKDRTIKDTFMSLILGSPDHRFDEYDKRYNLFKEK